MFNACLARHCEIEMVSSKVVLSGLIKKPSERPTLRRSLELVLMCGLEMCGVWVVRVRQREVIRPQVRLQVLVKHCFLGLVMGHVYGTGGCHGLELIVRPTQAQTRSKTFVVVLGQRLGVF